MTELSSKIIPESQGENFAEVLACAFVRREA
jgi:hypothetical protein